MTQKRRNRLKKRLIEGGALISMMILIGFGAWIAFNWPDSGDAQAIGFCTIFAAIVPMFAFMNSRWG